MIHPLADVKTENIGENTSVWQFSVILEGAIIGNNCNINCHTFIENNVVLGNKVTIKSGVYIWDGTTIEDEVFIGPSVAFVNDRYPRSKVHHDVYNGATIRKGASIGANATVMGNIEIGSYAMIGAGSVVTKDVPPFSLWYGNPALHKGYVTREGVVLGMDFRDVNGIKHELSVQ